jgi:hypothetical protein
VKSLEMTRRDCAQGTQAVVLALRYAKTLSSSPDGLTTNRHITTGWTNRSDDPSLGAW